MKVIFNHLNKTTLITSAYDMLKSEMEDRTKRRFKSLSKKQISMLKDQDEINGINNIHLGLKFKGNYVEFDDKLEYIYINLLYGMKKNNPYFIQKMTDDFIIEFEYKKYRKEIDGIEKDVDECKEIFNKILEQLVLIKDAMEKAPEYAHVLIVQAKELSTSKETLKKNLNFLLKMRKDKIIKIFELEGVPREYKTEDYDDIKIKEL